MIASITFEAKTVDSLFVRQSKISEYQPTFLLDRDQNDAVTLTSARDIIFIQRYTTCRLNVFNSKGIQVCLTHSTKITSWMLLET